VAKGIQKGELENNSRKPKDLTKNRLSGSLKIVKMKKGDVIAVADVIDVMMMKREPVFHKTE
jgi:hypothetical protein